MYLQWINFLIILDTIRILIYYSDNSWWGEMAVTYVNYKNECEFVEKFSSFITSQRIKTTSQVRNQTHYFQTTTFIRFLHSLLLLLKTKTSYLIISLNQISKPDIQFSTHIKKAKAKCPRAINIILSNFSSDCNRQLLLHIYQSYVRFTLRLWVNHQRTCEAIIPYTFRHHSVNEPPSSTRRLPHQHRSQPLPR